jgi:glutaminase
MNRFGYLPAAIVLAAAVTGTWAQSPAQIDAALKAAYDKYKDLKEGANADYIPALAKVDSKIYGIALVTTDGKLYTTGDITSEVSIQSISKVFTMAKVLEDQGPAAIENNMGVDATGQVFNSIVAVEQFKGAEMNPLVNPGAITATSMVKGPRATTSGIRSSPGTAISRDASSRSIKRCSSPSPTPISATRRSRC